MIKVLKTVLVLGLASAAPAFAAEYNYQVKGHPDDGRGCHVMARDLGNEFAAMTGITPLAAECTNIDENGFDFSIRYEAEEPLNLVSTQKLYTSIYNASAYTNAEDCAAALPVEKDRFVRATGLQALVAYCYFDAANHYRDYRYSVRVDSFGNPELAPQFSGAMIFGSPVGYTRGTFIEAVNRGLNDIGVDEVSFVKLESGSAYTELSTLYYATERLRMDLKELVKVRTIEQCQSALGDLRTALYTDAHQPVHMYCSAERIGGYYEVATIFVDQYMDLRSSAESFDSYEACEAARPGLEAFYRDNLGWNILGDHCGLHGDDFRLTEWKVAFLNAR